MSVAIFLDVDKTITTDYIQHVFARSLGVEQKYLELESRFQNRQIDSQAFGRELISMFAGQKFTKSMAEEFYSKVRLREWVERLFEFQKSGVAIYLVSSGPNYYIDRLRARYDIPVDHVLCSRYLFEGKNGVVSGCNPVEAVQKAQFVNSAAKKYSITVGVGDHPELDGPFVSCCTIAMLTEAHDNYIHLARFSSLLVLIQNLIHGNQSTDVVLPDDLVKVNLGNLLQRFSVGLWIIFAAALVTSFSLGIAVKSFYSAPSNTARNQ